MKMFLREGELAVDQAQMEATTDATADMDGLTTAAQNFGDVFASSAKDAKTAFKEAIIPSIMESKAGLLEAHKAAAELGKTMRSFELDEEATEAMKKSIQEATEARIAAVNIQTEGAIKSTELLNKALSKGIKLAGPAVEAAADFSEKGLYTLLSKEQGLGGDAVRVGQGRDITGETEELNKASMAKVQQDAELVAAMKTVAAGEELRIKQGQEAKYGFDQDALKQISEVPIVIQIDMDGDKMAEKTAQVYRKNGKELVVVPVQ
jgi:hypothetical protein